MTKISLSYLRNPIEIVYMFNFVAWPAIYFIFCFVIVIKQSETCFKHNLVVVFWLFFLCAGHFAFIVNLYEMRNINRAKNRYDPLKSPCHILSAFELRYLFLANFLKEPFEKILYRIN